MTDTEAARRRARAAYHVNHPTAAFRMMRHLAADVLVLSDALAASEEAALAEQQRGVDEADRAIAEGDE